MSYPEIELEQDIIEKLTKFFDLEINETFFEIVLINKHKKIINLFFEIPSEWSRGKKELAMLSLIMDEKYLSRLVYSFLVDAVQKIISTENIFKGFYKNDLFRDRGKDIEIDLKYQSIKEILYFCLSTLIERLKSKI
jgi:hypothetical protein